MKPSFFLSKLSSISKDELKSINGIGDIIGDNFIEFLSSTKFARLFQKFSILEDNNKSPEIIFKNISNNFPLYNKKICITGTFEISRNEIIQKLENLGAKLSNTVTKNTNFLLAGKDPGSKLEKAKKLSVPIYFSYKDFLNKYSNYIKQ